MANFQLQDTQQVPYTLTELDADGNSATPETGDVISVVSSASASLSVVPDATPQAGSLASGILVGGNTLATGVVVTASVQHTDGTSLTATDLVDVVGGAPATLSIGLGAPVSQPPAAIPSALGRKK